MDTFERRRLRVYVAGPMTSGGSFYNNVHQAIDIGRAMVADGLAPYLPQLDAFMFPAQDAGVIGWNAFLEWDLEWVAQSEALFLLPGWEQSKGASLERELALRHNIPVFEPSEYTALLRYARSLGLTGKRGPNGAQAAALHSTPASASVETQTGGSEGGEGSGQGGTEGVLPADGTLQGVRPNADGGVG